MQTKRGLSMKGLLKYDEVLKRFAKKGISEIELKEAIEKGKLNPLAINPATGNYCRYRVFKINDDGSLEGEFEE